jgi:protein-arginine kinase activator protein McsA
MTNEEMDKIATLVVDKIFARQEALDAEFMADMLENSIVIQANDIDDLVYALRLAEETENYELAAKLKKQIDKLSKRN